MAGKERKGEFQFDIGGADVTGIKLIFLNS